LIKNHRPYVLLKGEKKERLETAIREIDKILKLKPNLRRYSGK
jgi:hypothetical protein